VVACISQAGLRQLIGVEPLDSASSNLLLTTSPIVVGNTLTQPGLRLPKEMPALEVISSLILQSGGAKPR